MGSAPVLARSISRSVRDRLALRPCQGRVLALFERACILAFSEADLVALVLPEVGDGPLNIVLRAKPSGWAALQPHPAVWMEGSWLRVGELGIMLDGAAVWEPQPDWAALRAQHQAITHRLGFLTASLPEWAHEQSFLALLSASAPHRSIPGDSALPSQQPHVGDTAGACLAAAFSALPDLAAGLNGAWDRLRAGAAQLAGLGSGLTPAGDDFLVGIMHYVWLAHPAPARLCASLLAGSGSRTTALSAALLRAAAAGECSAPWHHVLRALANGGTGQVAAAGRDLVSYGHTSGADALAGFLWAGLHLGAEPIRPASNAYP